MNTLKPIETCIANISVLIEGLPTIFADPYPRKQAYTALNHLITLRAYLQISAASARRPHPSSGQPHHSTLPISPPPLVPGTPTTNIPAVIGETGTANLWKNLGFTKIDPRDKKAIGESIRAVRRRAHQKAQIKFKKEHAANTIPATRKLITPILSVAVILALRTLFRSK